MKKLILMTLLLLFCASISFARGGPGGGPGGGQGKGRRGGPPQEAITACESKNVGDSCSFTGRREETVSGTCVEVEEQIVCAPEGMERPDQDR